MFDSKYFGLRSNRKNFSIEFVEQEQKFDCKSVFLNLFKLAYRYYFKTILRYFKTILEGTVVDICVIASLKFNLSPIFYLATW